MQSLFQRVLVGSIATTILLAFGIDSTRAAAAPTSRFTLHEGFKIEEVVKPGDVGSLVAMAFDENGDILASRERGPLLRLRDKDHDGFFETVTTFCDKVNDCQGILPLFGQVFVVGDGPEKTGLYRLSDENGDGEAEKVATLFPFTFHMEDHGPHQPVLGPDGLIYVMVGNHAQTVRPPDATSPHHHFYDGELFVPKYEDANGHAVGIKAPCGTVVRTDARGSFAELFSGGFRNAYDIGVSPSGDFFTFDSDMEWDIGLPWYRPTRVNHITPGAEFGSRSGWSPWPPYYIDSLSPVIEIGRGSPTGLEFYDHWQFPRKYRGQLFMCDWSQGRILNVSLQPVGGTFQATSEVFLEGRPLNCADLAVGPDGGLYISVGGRNTEGSIFRVSATKPSPAPPEEKGILRAVHQPQFYSAWARARIVEVKKELGSNWEKSLVAIADDPHAVPADRTRALDLLQIFSPPPTAALLTKLSRDADVALRTKAVYLLGLHVDAAGQTRLVELLEDADPTVRRTACESLVRSQQSPPVAKLVSLLADPNRFVSWAACRAMERAPKADWQTTILTSDNPRIFLMGAVAIVSLDPDRKTTDAVLERSLAWLKQKKLDGDNFLDLLRVIEVTLCRARDNGGLPGQAQKLREQLSPLYPAGEWRVNRELVRLLVMLQDPALAPKIIARLGANDPLPEKIHAAMYARFLTVGWTPELRSRLVEFYVMARSLKGGNSYRGYLTNAMNDFLKDTPTAEQWERIAEGAKQPGVAAGLVQGIHPPYSAEQLATLQSLDRQVAADRAPPVIELRKVVLAKLAQGDANSRAYIHQVFESSPELRGDIAAAVASTPVDQLSADDWSLLARSLSVVEGSTARDVMRTLARTGKKNKPTPEQERQVILLGLRLGDQGGREAITLMQHWTGKKVVDSQAPLDKALGAWQKWFAKTYPNLPEATLPVETGNKWTYAQLMERLTKGSAAQGSPQRGAAVFDKALCVKCHRFDNRGEGIGPDLTTVSSRFQRKEILESILFPSQVISDQFAAKTVITKAGRVFSGLVGPAGGGVVVLQANAEKVQIDQKDIEEIVPSKKSAMPEGLLNTLTLEEIADLFAYLNQPPAAK